MFSFNNKQHFVLVPSPPHESDFFYYTFILNYLTMAKHRNDVPNSVNIIKPKAATRQLQKVLPFFLEDFWLKITLTGHVTTNDPKQHLRLHNLSILIKIFQSYSALSKTDP